MIGLALLAFVMAEPPTVKGFVPANAGPAVKGFVAAPEVAAPRTFPVAKFVNGSYHAGHDCPNCRTVQTDIDNDAGPTHTHKCEKPGCNTWWYHDDAVSTGPNLKVVRRLFRRW